jgi:hypothetical protein
MNEIAEKDKKTPKDRERYTKVFFTSSEETSNGYRNGFRYRRTHFKRFRLYLGAYRIVYG